MKTIVVKTDSRYEIHFVVEFPLTIPEGHSERSYAENCIREAELLRESATLPAPRALDVSSLPDRVLKSPAPKTGKK